MRAFRQFYLVVPDIESASRWDVFAFGVVGYPTLRAGLFRAHLFEVHSTVSAIQLCIETTFAKLESSLRLWPALWEQVVCANASHLCNIMV